MRVLIVATRGAVSGKARYCEKREGAKLELTAIDKLKISLCLLNCELCLTPGDTNSAPKSSLLVGDYLS